MVFMNTNWCIMYVWLIFVYLKSLPMIALLLLFVCGWLVWLNRFCWGGTSSSIYCIPVKQCVDCKILLYCIPGGLVYSYSINLSRKSRKSLIWVQMRGDHFHLNQLKNILPFLFHNTVIWWEGGDREKNGCKNVRPPLRGESRNVHYWNKGAGDTIFSPLKPKNILQI